MSDMYFSGVVSTMVPFILQLTLAWFTASDTLRRSFVDRQPSAFKYLFPAESENVNALYISRSLLISRYGLPLRPRIG
jgi:hypothetical protein